MMRYLFKHLNSFRVLIVVFIILASLFVSIPVYAIGNPNDIAFGSSTTPIAYAFKNVNETNDMLFLAESYIYYTPTYPTESSKQAFLFEILNAAGTSVLVSTPVWQYGDRPVSIYLTHLQADAIPLAPNTEYKMRLTGNPALFPTLTEGTNMITATLSSDWWVDQALATAEKNPLRNVIIQMLDNIEAEDAPLPAVSYIKVVDGVEYLSSPYGANLFLGGVPQLGVFCPSAFQTITNPMEAPAPTSAGTYAGSLTPLGQMGATMATGLTNFGTWLGIPQQMAGGAVYLGMTAIFCGWTYKRSGHPILPICLGAILPALGAWLGLIPFAVLMIAVLLIVVLVVWHFLGSKSI